MISLGYMFLLQGAHQLLADAYFWNHSNFFDPTASTLSSILSSARSCWLGLFHCSLALIYLGLFSFVGVGKSGVLAVGAGKVRVRLSLIPTRDRRGFLTPTEDGHGKSSTATEGTLVSTRIGGRPVSRRIGGFCRRGGSGEGARDG